MTRFFQDYQEVSSGDKNVLFKMKELWCYLGTLFPDKEKQFKKDPEGRETGPL